MSLEWELVLPGLLQVRELGFGLRNNLAVGFLPKAQMGHSLGWQGGEAPRS